MNAFSIVSSRTPVCLVYFVMNTFSVHVSCGIDHQYISINTSSGHKGVLDDTFMELH